MNASKPSSSEPREKSFFRGWIWFAAPLLVNLFFVTIPSFDYGYTAKLSRYFSIPYVAIAAVIGFRRGSSVTSADFLFLAFGNFAILPLLWHLNPPPHP